MVTAGSKVIVTGARTLSGRVLAVSEITMIVATGAAASVTLRRDPASLTPLEWRLGGLPVHVRRVAERSADFAERLAALAKRRP